MEKDNFQNTAEFRLRDTSEIKAVSENGEDGNDGYSEKSAKKQNIAAMIVCVVIAFVIWLIISNIKEPKGPVKNEGDELLPPAQSDNVSGDGSDTLDNPG